MELRRHQCLPDSGSRPLLPGHTFLEVSLSSRDLVALSRLCPCHWHSKEARRTVGCRMPFFIKTVPKLPCGLWTWLYGQPEPLCQPYSRILVVPWCHQNPGSDLSHSMLWKQNSHLYPWSRLKPASSRESQLSLGPTSTSPHIPFFSRSPAFADLALTHKEERTGQERVSRVLSN